MLLLRAVLVAACVALAVSFVSAQVSSPSSSYDALSMEDKIDYLLSSEFDSVSIGSKSTLAKRFDNVLQPRFFGSRAEKCHDEKVAVECVPKLAVVASKEYLVNDKSAIASVTSCTSIPKGDEAGYICDDFGRFQQLAIKAKPFWDTLLRDFVAHLVKNKRYTTNDVIAIPAPIKLTARAREKGVRYTAVTGNDGGAAGVSDYLRGGLVFRTFALLRDGICELNTFLPKYEVTWEGQKITPFSVLDTENKFLNPLKSCYSDFNLKIKFKGLIIELQTNFCSMFTVKEQAHGIYEQARKLAPTSPEAIALDNKLSTMFKAAWTKASQDQCTLSSFAAMATATFQLTTLSPPKPAVPFSAQAGAAAPTTAAPAAPKK